MIHVLHGFLGGPEDFSFLAEYPEVNCHDLYETDFRSIAIAPNDVIIGYSMGGRIAMELACKKGFELEKLVLINAHPGLSTEEERRNRLAFEDEVLKQLDSDGFTDYWNSLPIFANDYPLPTVSDKKRVASKRLFEELRLSRQTDFLPLLSINKSKVLYISGMDDVRYNTLAKSVLAPTGIRCREIPGGHRLFQYPPPLLNVLTEEGIL